MIIKSLIHRIRNYRYPKVDLDGFTILSALDSNNYLYNLIRNNDKPFLVSRFGTSEISGFWQQYFWERFPFFKFPKMDKILLSRNAGMFSVNPRGRHIFKKYMIDAIKQIDADCFFYAPEETTIIKKWCKNTPILLDYSILSFYNLYEMNNNWITALEGKKVLVVSPFADSMEKQYKIKDLLFTRSFRLPNFTFISLKSPQTQNGEDKRFATWESALLYMYNIAKKIDFDIALLGCGSYGLPLQGLFKKMGKSSIYVGGALSIMFGVYGKRWEKFDFINQYWVKPPKVDVPKCAEEIENGCYW